MAYTWQDHEAFHFRFCQGLYLKEALELPVGITKIPNAYDTQNVLLFAGKNVTYGMPEVMRQAQEVADAVQLPVGFYVTPTWEDADVANRALAEAGVKHTYSVDWYHCNLEPMEEPEGLVFSDTVDAAEFETLYGEVFGGNGWEPWMGKNPSGVNAQMLYARNTDGKLVGFGAMAWEGKIGYLFAMGVAADERRKGYGMMISRMRMAKLAAMGVTELVTAVVEENEASVAMRKPLGFEIFARAEWWGGAEFGGRGFAEATI